MRSLLVILSLLVPISAFSLSCPNNGSILKTGDSIQEVTKRCGEAISSNSFTNTVITSGESIYYITNSSNNRITKTSIPDHEHAVKPSSPNNRVTKMTILHDHGYVANINIFLSGKHEQNVQSSNVCGKSIQIGDNMRYVQSVCGNPALQNTFQTTSTPITELKYDGMTPNTLIFEDDKLKNWK